MTFRPVAGSVTFGRLPASGLVLGFHALYSLTEQTYPHPVSASLAAASEFGLKSFRHR